MHPEDFADILRTPEPEREIPPAPSPELYNLTVDPGEEQDVSGDHPDVVCRMMPDLENWFDDVERDRIEAVSTSTHR